MAMLTPTQKPAEVDAATRSTVRAKGSKGWIDWLLDIVIYGLCAFILGYLTKLAMTFFSGTPRIWFAVHAGYLKLFGGCLLASLALTFAWAVHFHRLDEREARGGQSGPSPS